MNNKKNKMHLFQCHVSFAHRKFVHICVRRHIMPLHYFKMTQLNQWGEVPNFEQNLKPL